LKISRWLPWQHGLSEANLEDTESPTLSRFYLSLLSLKMPELLPFEVTIGHNASFQIVGEKGGKCENSSSGAPKRKRIIWYKDRENRYTMVTCRRGKEMKKEKKKVTNGDISCMHQDHPRRPHVPIFGSLGRVHDTHPNFRGDQFRGFASQGSRKSHISYT